MDTVADDSVPVQNASASDSKLIELSAYGLIGKDSPLRNLCVAAAVVKLPQGNENGIDERYERHHFPKGGYVIWMKINVPVRTKGESYELSSLVIG